jgi:3-oxoadipate enol-lactonase
MYLIPTYIIIGSDDAEDILLIAEEYNNRMPQSQKIVVKDAAHLINMEQPERFNAILRSILNI